MNIISNRIAVKHLLAAIMVMSVIGSASFIPRNQVHASFESLLKLPQSKVADIMPVAPDYYFINLSNVTEIYLSVGNEEINVMGNQAEWPEAFSYVYYYSDETEGTHHLSMTSDQDYSLTFKTGTAPVDISVQRQSTEGLTVEYVRYCNCSWDAPVMAQIDLSQKKISDLYYDDDNDGVADQTVKPNVRAYDIHGVDTEAPTVTGMEIYKNNQRLLTIKAQDNKRVKNMYYYFGEPVLNTDGSPRQENPVYYVGQAPSDQPTWLSYSKPIPVTQENLGKTIFFTAIDVTGNQSTVYQHTIGSIIPSLKGENIPSWAKDGDVVRFANDDRYYIVNTSEFESEGLYPFGTLRTLEYYLKVSGVTPIFSQEDANNYYRFTSTTVESNFASYIIACPDHPYKPGSLVADKGTIYFISGCTKTPFSSMDAFTGLGYNLKNVVAGNLDPYKLTSLPAVTTKDSAHPWGSWVHYNGTVYYSVPENMIIVPSPEIFANNGGDWSKIVPATQGDIEEIALATADSAMTENDYTVAAMTYFGPSKYDLEGYSSVESRRDQKRYSDAIDLYWAINNYLDQKHKLPTQLTDLVPDYLAQLPTTPSPADGSCSEQDNQYRYEATGKKEYDIYFCLGHTLYGQYEPGVHKVSELYLYDY